VSVRCLSIARQYDRLNCVVAKNTGLSCPSAATIHSVSGGSDVCDSLSLSIVSRALQIPAVEICNSCRPFCLLDSSP
jgi:hypothetical protein